MQRASATLLVTALSVMCGPAPAQNVDKRKPHAATASPSSAAPSRAVVRPAVKDGEAEARLIEIYKLAGQARGREALVKAERLVDDHPNFQLAQLVYGDLLAARSRPLRAPGDMSEGAAKAGASTLAELRQESLMRLKALRERPAPGTIPSQFLALSPRNKHAIAVDASRARLYLFENTATGLKLVSDYYISVGKSGIEKSVEGDSRTPLGIYFVTSNLDPKSLKDFYGSGALPINYPNALDLKRGKTGSGIWLHGTPPAQFSRAPQASDGCVVLANDDLDKLAPYLQVGVTPVIITNQLDWANEQDRAERNALLQEVEQWRKDWSSLDTNTYLKHYSRDFSSDNVDFAAWAKQKQLVNSAKSWIKVNISNVSVFTYPKQPNMAVVNFEQDYSSSNLSNRMKKRQYWIKHNNRWQIVYEGAA